jgi:hypothetical protein
MFNAISTPDLIAGMGRTMRAAAGAEGEADEYARSQLLSAYSISRLLAAEVRAEAELLAWLRGELLAALAEADGAEASAADSARGRIEEAADSGAVGDALVDLLAELRQLPDSPLRVRVHAVLREMATRELAALATRPQRARKSGNGAQ